MKTCGNIDELARELQVERKSLLSWKRQLEGLPVEVETQQEQLRREH
jgi:hypothetical protein